MSHNCSHCGRREEYHYPRIVAGVGRVATYHLIALSDSTEKTEG